MKDKITKTLNVCWKIGVTFVGLWLMFSVVELIGARYGRARWMDKTISADIVVREYRNSTCRVYNKRTEQYTTPRLRWVAGTPERDSITVFCDKRGYRGFLNVNTGEIVIPAQYGKAWQFSEGLAAVEYGKKQLGFINHDNELVIEDIPHESGFFDYVFKNGTCVILTWVNGDQVYSIYSSKTLGKIGEYDGINHLDRGGYKIVRNEEGYWLLDRYYNRVFNEPYEELEEAYYIDGVFVVHNGVKQLWGYDGTVLEPFVIDGTKRLTYAVDLTDPYYDSDGFYYDQKIESEIEPDLVAYRAGSFMGLMNANTGEIITPAIYGDITMISKDLLRAELNNHNEESVILDRNGKPVE